MFTDTALTALPFFYFGFVANRHTGILIPNRYDKYLPLLISILSSITFFFSGGAIDYPSNHYDVPVFTFYGCALSGILAVIFISKMLRTLPFVSYCGRYSIMILLTHNVFIQFILIFTKKACLDDWGTIFLTLAIVMSLYLLVIPLMKKYLPHITAQKDVLKV